MMKISWRILKFLFVVAITVIGIAGIPDDLATWQKWIDRMMRDPVVTELAEKAVNIAEFVNHPAIRITLVIVAIIVLIWPARRFWRLRHRLIYSWRKALQNEVWVSREAALALVINSRWGAVMAPIKAPFSALQFLVAPDSKEQRKDKRFRQYCQLLLEKFEETNSRYVREEDNAKEYREDKLRQYLNRALVSELESEFGELPDIAV